MTSYNALLHSGCTPPHAWSSSTAHILARIHRRTMTIFENVTKTGIFFIYFFVQTVHIKVIEKKNKKLFSVIWFRWDLSQTGLEKNNKNYFAKHFSESNDRKWVKMELENLNISFITFHRVTFTLSICTTPIFVFF